MTTDGDSIGSVTDLLRKLQNGETTDVQQAIWDRYFQRLAGFARTKLTARARRAADEEDVALSALHSFFAATAEGRYPSIRDRTELWPLLACIAGRRAIKLNEHEFRQKRGGGTVRGDSAFDEAAEDSSSAQKGFDSLMGHDPSPEAIAELRDVTDQLLRKLADQRLTEIARLKLSGYTNREIADQLDVTERTIERKLTRIRHFWAIVAEDAV